MSFQDKSLECVECGAGFTFSTEEQEFFQSRGYTNEPNALSLMPPGEEVRALRKQQLRVQTPDVSRDMRRVWQGHRSTL